ncbi:uncharacterized protein LOC110829516 isoform X3 [Zootermopsis nevadensis]|uniref:uncharacterized protein LOC110829516 isoform X3 n=1 Tax=Zootermopsis nevadensis TaxID=136037 RepID=UPI000B8EBE38|nr:uncharacterized protein LOC110829516 isoform X3 [Zootermopsis nevadensis]
MYLPLALHQAFIYTLQMFHLFGIFHLISVIFHKISTFRTNFRRRTRRRQLFAWLQQALPTGREIRHLSAVWRDGTILCDVIESVVPGSCSGHLRKFHSHKSIHHGQTLAANHLCVQPVFTNEDLHQVIFSSYLERRLLRYLTTIKSAVLERRQSHGTLSRRLRFFRRTERNATETQQVPALPPFDCFVKGMGVVVAVQLRRASFYIYLLQSSYVSHQPHASLPDISVKIEGPNSDHGEVIIQTTCFNKWSKQTKIHSQSCVCQPCERVCNIPINYSVTSGNIRVNYVPQNPGLHELSITMCDKHVPGSPYLISVDRKDPDITGPLTPGMSADKNDPRILPERRRHKVLFRIVDFVTEKMLLTEDGELKQLPSEIRVTAKRFPRQMAIHSSPHGISNSPFSCYTDDSTEEYNMQHGTISSKAGS